MSACSLLGDGAEMEGRGESGCMNVCVIVACVCVAAVAWWPICA